MRGPTGMAVFDLQGRVVAANNAFAELVGYEIDELRSLRVDDLSNAFDLARERIAIRQVLFGGRDHFRLRKRYVRRDGSSWAARMTCTISRSATGAATAITEIVETMPRRAV